MLTRGDAEVLIVASNYFYTDARIRSSLGYDSDWEPGLSPEVDQHELFAAFDIQNGKAAVWGQSMFRILNYMDEQFYPQVRTG